MSTESLPGIADELVRLEVPIKHHAAAFFCPSGDLCDQKMKGHQIDGHITDVHQVAVIAIGQAAAVVDLPPRAPIADASLVLRLDDHRFWIKVWLSADQAEYFVTCLIQSGPNEAARYYLELTVGNANANKILSKEIVSRCAVHSLQQHSWKDLLAAKDGIILTRESIESTFEVGHNILLTAAIRHI